MTVPVLDPAVAIVGPAPSAGRLEHLLVREGLTVTDCVEDIGALQAVSDTAHPHVVVMLVDEDQDPAACIQALWARLPQTRVVLVPSDPRATTVRDAMRAGAAGVVREADVALAIGSIARSVSLGYAVVPLDERSVLARPQRQQLSVREREILTLAAEGFTNAEIGQQLHLAESTVKSHLSSVFSKLGVHSRAELSTVLRDGRVNRPSGTRSATPSGGTSA